MSLRGRRFLGLGSGIDRVVASVTRSPATIVGEPGDTVTFQLQAKNAANQSLAGKTYTAVSASPSIVQVVSVVGRTVTCSILDITAGVNVVGTCETVDAPACAVSATWVTDSVELTPSSRSGNSGDTVHFTAEAFNRNAVSLGVQPTFTADSSDTDVATIGTIAGADIPVDVVGVDEDDSCLIQAHVGGIDSNAVTVTKLATGSFLHFDPAHFPPAHFPTANFP